ncbi:N-6 DNA methylase [Actinoplanes sp. NPDC049596]|uniref:N-6 DNA methylase n=1 Tax=unclassified Actinoplanes TaxID=2626549 RepID=UPI00344529B6
MAGRARVTAADIARFAGVGRAAVSNWRKRYESFPAPVGGTAASPQFDLEEVDRWLTENGKALAIPDEHRLWRDLVEAQTDPAEAIARAAEQLSGARPLADATLRAELDALVARPDGGGARRVLHQLWAQFADTPARRAASTPDHLASLMVRLARINAGTVLDPACGNGQLLRAAAKAGATDVFGQDIDEPTARLAAAWLAVADVTGQIRTGDSLRADAFPGLAVDAVLGHLPFGQTNWGQEELGYDARWEFGVPPRTEPELAWVQHAHAHLKPGGLAVLLMPPSAAARRAGRRIRAELLRKGSLRAVIALPPGAVTAIAGALHVWILQRAVGAPAPTILLADGRAIASPDSMDLPETFDGIAQAAETFLDGGDLTQSTFAHEIPVIDLLDDEVDLTPARHAPAGLEHADLVRELVANHRTLELQAQWLAKHVPTPLKASADDSSPPPTISIADLARSGALEILGPIRGDDGDPADVRVLTAEDVLREKLASGSDERLNQRILLKARDVVIPMVARRLASTVVEERDLQGEVLLGRNLYALRCDPQVLNPWFLAAHLRTSANERQATSLSGLLRFDVRKAQVPRVPIAEQRRHGAAFEQLYQLNRTARQVRDLSAEMTRLTVEGLAFGKLRPTEENY